MEAGYVKADSRNLPDIDHLMIAEFFSSSDLYLSAEIRSVKNLRWVFCCYFRISKNFLLNNIMNLSFISTSCDFYFDLLTVKSAKLH